MNKNKEIGCVITNLFSNSIYQSRTYFFSFANCYLQRKKRTFTPKKTSVVPGKLQIARFYRLIALYSPAESCFEVNREQVKSKIGSVLNA